MKKKVLLAIVALAVVLSVSLSLVACANKGDVKVIDIRLTEEEYAFCVSKNDDAFLAQVNAFITKIENDGTKEAIVNKYFSDGGAPTAVESATKDASKDQLIVATNAAFPPFEYKEGNKFYGVDMEIAKALATELGKELVIDDMEFDAVVPSVNQGKAHIGMAGLTVNEVRKESVNFAKSYYNASQVIVVKAGDTRFDGCTTAAEVEAVIKGLTSATVGSQKGTTGQYYVEGDEDWGFDGFSNVTSKTYDNGALAVLDMTNGKLDFVVIDEAPAKAIADSFNKK